MTGDNVTDDFAPLDFKKEVYGDGEEEWCLEDMGASSPDRYFYKDGKIEEGWSTPMEDEE